MGDFTCWQQSITVYLKKLEKGRDQPTSSPPQFHINFRFSCKTLNYNWVLRQDSRRHGQLLNTASSPMIDKLICMNIQQFLSYEEARETICEEIKDWFVCEDHARRMSVDLVLNKTREVVISMSPRHNTVNLHFLLVTLNMNVFDERRAISWAIRQSDEEEDNGGRMIPATESSIESLERKTIIMDSGACSICMEEFSYGCEALSMPCSHVFHGDCIKTWLKTSHYCPICRFEMPIS